jgi:hypothetical protein|tara:strand:+ start:941 stop:1093 length:153 start_codon:yes stop_codon:yes gene_type:complete
MVKKKFDPIQADFYAQDTWKKVKKKLKKIKDVTEEQERKNRIEWDQRYVE